MISKWAILGIVFLLSACGSPTCQERDMAVFDRHNKECVKIHQDNSKIILPGNYRSYVDYCFDISMKVSCIFTGTLEDYAKRGSCSYYGTREDYYLHLYKKGYIPPVNTEDKIKKD